MFKSAATKIAHNTTIPALAGNSDLRPLQDLITAEKTVLTSLQRLKVDLTKAGDALRIWGQGEGDDLGDILAASSTMLAYFATALSTYSSLHHTVRDSMKSVRSREEALDDLRRRRRRIGASAEAAEKKLNKMSPEHKNLGTQAEMLNKLREEMRVLDVEILREEAELGDYKRKCTKDWMGFKFGGLVECCEKGVIVGDIGRQIIQSIPEDTTQPGLPRAYYNGHGHVGDLVVEAQRAAEQVVFTTIPAGVTSEPISQPPTSQGPPAQSPFLPTPSLGSELTLGVAAYNSPLPANRRTSIDELGLQAPSHAAPQFSSLPANRERDPPPVPPSVSPAWPPSPSIPYDSGVARSEENQSLMASIAGALSYTHRGLSLEEAPPLSPDEPVPKYEPFVGVPGSSAQSEPHAPVTNGHAGPPEPRRATRRSTSPPSLPPGAAPAAIRAWDDRMGQGEDGAHSDRPASSSAGLPSQRPTSSSERDGEEEDESPCEHEKQLEKEDVKVEIDGDGDGDGKHREEDVPASVGNGEPSADAVATLNDQQGTTPIQRTVSISAASRLSRAGSQWRIPRVPPPPVDPDMVDDPDNASENRRSVHSAMMVTQEEDEPRTEESADVRAHNEAAAREVSRAMDALEFNATAPPSTMISSGYPTPRGPSPGYGLALAMQGQAAVPHSHALPQSLSSLGSTPYSSVPPSPITSPMLPSANRSRGSSSSIDMRANPGRQQISSESLPGRLQMPTSTVVSGNGGVPATPRSTSPKYRSPPSEYPRPTPPFSSSYMARSTSSLNGGGTSPVTGPRTISAAAFRRQPRSPSGTEPTLRLGPADTSPLTLRKPSGSSGLPPALMPGAGTGAHGVPSPPPPPPPKARLSVMNPDPRISDDEGEGGMFDYIGAYSRDSTGYSAGQYVSDLEKP